MFTAHTVKKGWNRLIWIFFFLLLVSFFPPPLVPQPSSRSSCLPPSLLPLFWTSLLISFRGRRETERGAREEKKDRWGGERGKRVGQKENGELTKNDSYCCCKYKYRSVLLYYCSKTNVTTIITITTITAYSVFYYWCNYNQYYTVTDTTDFFH